MLRQVSLLHSCADDMGKYLLALMAENKVVKQADKKVAMDRLC
jgi:hypothetical protein